MNFHHGIKVTEPISGARTLAAVATAVVGIVATAGDAQADVKATLETGVVPDDNALTFTAAKAGKLGNTITLALVDPAANDAALQVSVAGDAITVSLATGGDGSITTTAAQLVTAIEASAAADALVAVADTGTSDGSGVVTALPATALSGGVDEPFPLNRPALVTDIRDAIGKAGDDGTLKPTLEAIADQATPILVVVRVEEGADDAATATNVIGGVTDGQFTGVEALLAAEAEVGVRPRILGAPGLDSQAVVEAMVVAARKLRGFVYAAAKGEDTAAALLYRKNFAARELMLIWPDFSTGGAFPGDAVARALGLRAAIDESVGWHKTLSMVPVAGVTGLTKDVHFDLQDSSTTAGVLNAGEVTTMVRLNGYRFFGNRTCADEPAWAFESRVRTAQALQDTIAGGLAWAIDKPLTPGLVRDIIETINAEFRRLVAEGRLIGAEVLPLDIELNSESYLASGKLAIDYEFTDAAPLENLNLSQRVTDRFYADFSQQIANG
ncbi:MAG: phage tail protein [Citromicrobium sp.]|nr:phage tail protein [Citromicrobium sp.]